jgi:hypothetical protein
MKAYIAIVMAENTLKGMNLTDGQKGELLFSVIAESKLNNPLIKAWEEIKMEKVDNATPLGHKATQTDFNIMLVSHFHLLKTFENNKKIHEGKAPDQEKKKRRKRKRKEKVWKPNHNRRLWGSERAKQKSRQDRQIKEVFGMSERKALLNGVL